MAPEEHEGPRQHELKRVEIQRGPGKYWRIAFRAPSPFASQRLFRRAVWETVILDVILITMLAAATYREVATGNFSLLALIALLLLLSAVVVAQLPWWRRVYRRMRYHTLYGDKPDPHASGTSPQDADPA